jgi:tryptophan-rich sensory protein
MATMQTTGRPLVADDDVREDAGRPRGTKQVLALAGFVVLSQLAGLIGLPFNDGDAQRWYEGLDRSFTPPDAVFAPVWTTLYVLMGVAAWLVWRTRHPERRAALAVFFVQLAINAAWTPIFFGARALTLGAVWIAVLACAVAATIWRFARVHVAAALLLVPYLAWVGFAAVLNGTIAASN